MTVGKKAAATDRKPKNTFFAARAFVLALIAFFLPLNLGAQKSAGSAQRLFDQGAAFQDEREWWKASEKYMEALKANPSFADAWFRLAQCDCQMDNPEAALERLQNAKKYAPGRVDVLNLEGLALITLGRLDEAQKIFEDIQKKYPNDIDSRFGLAELNLFKGRVSGAESLYADALKRNPQNAKALLSLALISAELGKASQAERFAGLAIRSRIMWPPTWTLGRATWRAPKSAVSPQYKSRPSTAKPTSFWPSFTLGKAATPKSWTWPTGRFPATGTRASLGT